MAAAVSSTNAQQHLEQAVGAIFDLFDADHDGVLSQADYLAVDTSLGATDAKASANAFAQLVAPMRAPGAATGSGVSKAQYVAHRVKSFGALDADALHKTLAGLKAQISALSQAHGHSHGGGGHGHAHGGASRHGRGGDHDHGHGHDHGHDHGDMRHKMVACESKGLVALLTAHLSSADGNELDVFFEAKGKPKQPQTVKAASIEAKIVIAAAGGAAASTATVTFEPAPEWERPAGEKGDVCSHYVAKTPTVQANSVLSCTFAVGGSNFAWNDFLPIKFAHHQD